MLTSIRTIAGTWLGKAILVVVFGILIFSFAIWGIGDIFRGYGTQTVAKVGSTEIGVEAVRQQFRQRIQQEQQRTRGFTTEQARLMGIDRRVVAEMIAEAALNQEAQRMGLNISAEDVARQLANETAFKGADGRFSRPAFDNYLREVGLSETSFLQQQRQATLRQHIAESLTGGIVAPDALMQLIHRYRNEERTLRYLTVPGSIAVSLALPPEEQLIALHAERKAQFRAPAYRKFNALVLEPAEFVAEIVLTDADLRAAYDAGMAQNRYGTPERRRVQQILFPKAEEAIATAARIKGGLTFDALLTEMKLKPEDIDLGLKARTELIDRAVGTEAFGLALNTVSEPVNGQFGTVLLRVTEIAPGQAQPFDSVRYLIRSELTAQRLGTDRAVRAKVDAIHDKIEELRASGKSLEQVATEIKRPVTAVAASDAQGRDKAGEAISPLPDQADVIKAVFASDRGVDNEAIRTRTNGYVWFEILSLEASRERDFAEVKAQVGEIWRRDEANRLSLANASALLKRFEAGESLEAIGAEFGGQVEMAEGVRREGAATISPTAAAIAFTLPVNGKGIAATGAGSDRLLMEVTASNVPVYEPAATENASIKTQLDRALRNDILDQYVTQVQNRIGSTINERALAQATGTQAQ
jgi:peptidyl-prolyl cis-trans isomerase D